MKKEGGQNAFAFCHTLFFLYIMLNWKRKIDGLDYSPK